MTQSVHMSAGEISDLDIIAHAGAIWSWIIRPENFHSGPMAERSLDRHLNEMGRISSGLARAALGIGAGDIEISQYDMAQIVPPACVCDHPFDHHLGAAVGRDGLHGLVFRDRILLRVAVDRRGRGKDEILNTRVDGALEQRARLCGVVEIIAERIGHRFRDDGPGGEMHNRLDFFGGENSSDKVRITDITDDEFCLSWNRNCEAGQQIIEDNNLFTCVEEFENHMATDKSSSAGNKNGHSGYHPEYNFDDLVTSTVNPPNSATRS